MPTISTVNSSHTETNTIKYNKLITHRDTHNKIKPKGNPSLCWLTTVVMSAMTQSNI